MHSLSRRACPRGRSTEEGPVFVDASGRRARIIRRAGLAVGIACAGYAVLLGVAFAGGTPFAPQTLIPGADVPEGASAQAEAGGRTGGTAERVASAPAAAHAPAPVARGPAAAPTVVAAAEVTPSATGRRATASATPSAGPGATATASASPRPTSARTPTATASPSASVPVTAGPDTPAFPPGDAGGDPVPGDGWDD